MYRLIFIICLFCLSSCGKDQPNLFCEDTLSCATESCLFTINNSEGVTALFSCYDRYGIVAEHPSNPDQNIWLIPTDWDDSYKVLDRSVLFCGFVKENTVPLQFPDPLGLPVYEIDLEGLE